ncbi:MAG: NifB/NifX family molybdenum-iron cluster-binding protein [Deltaproteobacteria bacterium]|nr:NifB/NifX family molybdenum-iron cluster-binding protein [Deltaproteobacteria bacterium]
MKAAITVWNGRISPVFDVCREALILDIEKGRVVSTITERFEGASPLTKISRLSQLGVKTLICGAISEALSHELTDRNIDIIGFVAGPVEEVIQAFLSKSLPTAALDMPGYCGRRKRVRGGPGSKGGRRRQRSRLIKTTVNDKQKKE